MPAGPEEPVTEPIRRPSINTEVLPSDFPRPEARKTPVPIIEYEALFKDGEEEAIEDEEKPAKKDATVHRFPSKDVWEDAPSSVHYTAEVSTPDIPADEGRLKPVEAPERHIPTPVQAFAQYQEELAEKEAERTKNFVPRGENLTQSWLPVQELPKEPLKRPPIQKRFPSRDIWEDAPDSLLHETTVSSDQQPETKPDQPEIPPRPTKSVEKPVVPERPARSAERPAVPERPARRSSERPVIPERPRPKKELSGEGKPVVSDKPKPQIPPRPVKASSASASPVEASEQPALPKSRPTIPARPNRAPAAVATEAKEAPAVPKAKPAIPARPMGSKIAALQAGFMSDLNRRLQLGPQAPKKEDPAPEVAAEEEKESVQKQPLADARKGRARGPQRRAPARSPAPPAVAAAASTETKPRTLSFSFSKPQTVWSIDPEESDLVVGSAELVEAAEAPKAEPLKPEPSTSESEKESSPPAVSEPEPEPEAEPIEAEPKSDESPKSEPGEVAAAIPEASKSDLAENKAPVDEPKAGSVSVDEIGDKVEVPEVDAGAVTIDKVGDVDKPVGEESSAGGAEKPLDVENIRA